MWFKVCVLLCALFAAVDCYNILVLMNVPSHSHHKWMSVYVEALVKRGHHVTFASVDQYKNPPTNVTPFYLENAYNLYGEVDFVEISKENPYKSYLSLVYWYEGSSRDQFKANSYQQLLQTIKNEKFDGIVYDLGGCPFALGLVDRLGRPPVVGITAFGIPPWVMDYSATPYPIANSPHFTYPLGKDLTFFNRLENAAFYMFTWYCYHYMMLPVQEELARSAFGEDIRTLHEIQTDINVNMINANWASDNAFPLPPSLIPIGGLHIAKPKALPKDLKDFLDSAKDGAIFFSFGSNIQCSQLPQKTIFQFVEAFQRLAPIQVLWKWEVDNLPNKPTNVKIGKWLPQNDILAHPNVRLFITHGGMLSSQEALYHGVPVVGIPFFIDQVTNIKRAESNGYAVMMELEHLQSNMIVKQIRNIFQNPKFKETATRLSKIFRDDLNPPLERALFWTEYAIRHNGAAHLKPPSHRLMWLQSSLFDVIAVFLTVLLVALYLVYRLAKAIKSLFGLGKKVKKDKKS